MGFLWICRNRRTWHAKKTPTCCAETHLERMQDAGGLLPHHEDPQGRVSLRSYESSALESEVWLKVSCRAWRARGMSTEWARR